MFLVVDLDELERCQEYLRKINAVSLSYIRWRRNGVNVNPKPEDLEEWKFIGLNNTAFAELRLNGPTE